MKLISSAIFFSMLVLIVFTSSCKNDEIIDMPEPEPMGCDTTNISFSITIVPILEQGCYNGCHNGMSPSSEISLDTYQGVKIKTDETRFIGAIEQQVGYVAMPLGGDKLPDCELAQFRNWVSEGALDN